MRRPGSLLRTVTTIGAVSIAGAAAIFGGLAAQMANGEDPALSSKPRRDLHGQTAQPQGNAADTIQIPAAPAPDPDPAPVVTRAS
jgi:hypothetical protein